MVYIAEIQRPVFSPTWSLAHILSLPSEQGSAHGCVLLVYSPKGLNRHKGHGIVIAASDMCLGMTI